MESKEGRKRTEARKEGGKKEVWKARKEAKERTIALRTIHNTNLDSYLNDLSEALVFQNRPFALKKFHTLELCRSSRKFARKRI